MAVGNANATGGARRRPDRTGTTTITCTVGNASATGVTALQNITLQTGVGSAGASGVQAIIARLITCSVADATAVGVAAQLQRIFGMSVGNAIASGVTAALSGDAFSREPEHINLLGVSSQRSVSLTEPARQIGALLKG